MQQKSRFNSASNSFSDINAGVKVGRHYRRYGVPADATSVPADSAAAVVKFTISIPHESCPNAKAKYSSSVVPPDPSVHFYHCINGTSTRSSYCDRVLLTSKTVSVGQSKEKVLFFFISN